MGGLWEAWFKALGARLQLLSAAAQGAKQTAREGTLAVLFEETVAQYRKLNAYDVMNAVLNNSCVRTSSRRRHLRRRLFPALVACRSSREDPRRAVSPSLRLSPSDWRPSHG